MKYNSEIPAWKCRQIPIKDPGFAEALATSCVVTLTVVDEWGWYTVVTQVDLCKCYPSPLKQWYVLVSRLLVLGYFLIKHNR